MDVGQYFESVREERDIIFTALQQQSKEQPRGATLDKTECRKKGFTSGYYDGWCYITSVKNRQAQTIEGSICEATINLAGQRIAEGTHRLATDEEIRAYKKASQERAADLKRSEAALQAQLRKQVFIAPAEAK